MHSKQSGRLQQLFPSSACPPSNSTAHHRYAIDYNTTMHAGNNTGQSASLLAQQHPLSAPPTQANFPQFDRRMSEPMACTSNDQLEPATCYPATFAHPQPSSSHLQFAFTAPSELATVDPPAFSTNSWSSVNSSSPISTTPPLSPTSTSFPGMSVQIPLCNAASLGDLSAGHSSHDDVQSAMSSLACQQHFPVHTDLEFEMEMEMEMDHSYGASPPGTGTSNSSPPMSASFPAPGYNTGVPFSSSGNEMVSPHHSSLHVGPISSSLNMRSSPLEGHGSSSHGISISLPAATITLPTSTRVVPLHMMRGEDEHRRPSIGLSQGSDSKSYSFVALPGNTVKKRPRRRYDEIERLYKCEWAESGIDSIDGRCTKAYGTLNHLNAHVSMQKHGPKRSPNEFKERRKQWRKAKKEQEARTTHPMYNVDDGSYGEGTAYEYDDLDRYDDRTTSHSPHLVAQSPHGTSISPRPAQPSIHPGHPTSSYHHHAPHPYATGPPEMRYPSEGRYPSHPEMRHANSHPNMRYTSASPATRYPSTEVRYPSPSMARYPPQSSVRYTQAGYGDFSTNYRSVDRNDTDQVYRVPDVYRTIKEEEDYPIKEGHFHEDHRARYGSWAPPSRGVMPPVSPLGSSPHSNSPPLQQQNPHLTLSIPPGVGNRIQGGGLRLSTDSGSSGLTFLSTGSSRISQDSVMSRLFQDAGVGSGEVLGGSSVSTPASGYTGYNHAYDGFGQQTHAYLMPENASQFAGHVHSSFEGFNAGASDQMAPQSTAITANFSQSRPAYNGSPDESPDEYDDGSGEYRED